MSLLETVSPVSLRFNALYRVERVLVCGCVFSILSPGKQRCSLEDHGCIGGVGALQGFALSRATRHEGPVVKTLGIGIVGGTAY